MTKRQLLELALSYKRKDDEQASILSILDKSILIEIIEALLDTIDAQEYENPELLEGGE